jgi:tetratricopeptide (TPR) repeat protein
MEVSDKVKRQTLLTIFAVVLVLDATALAQNNTLQGKVRAANGATVNNAIVELRMGGGGMIAQTVTRNDGDFAFSGLATGEYEVAVMLAGYEPAVQMAHFNHSGRMDFSEVVHMEILIREKKENVLLPPGTSFSQDVPKPARLAYERAVGRLREGKNEEAIAALREAIANFNDYFDAHFALGRELFREGKEDEAIKALERAREINDRQDSVYHLFGLVMMKQGKYAIAEFAFREATRLNANNVFARFYHGLALIELAVRSSDEQQRNADLSAAEKELDRAWDRSAKRLPEVFLQRARIHERRGQKEAAAADLESYLKAVPEAKNGAKIRAAIAQLRGSK